MTTEAIKALVSAQSEMTAAHKGKVNPAFRSKYAELSDVMDACLPALRNHGFAVVQPIGRDERGDYVETHILHESGHAFTSRAYLIIGKQDMQGFGSAITYARRYSLAALAGVTDTDDDGNAAAKSPPVRPGRPAGYAAPGHDSANVRPAEPPHDPVTGEFLPGTDRDSPYMPQGAQADEVMPPSVATFIDQVKEQLAMNGCEKPTREQLEHGYAMAVIENIAKRKSNAKAKQWFGIFCDLHAKAIGRIQDEGLKSQVRSAIAMKQAMIDGEKPDPADYGHPFGQEPIVLGEIPVDAMTSNWSPCR